MATGESAFKTWLEAREELSGNVADGDLICVVRDGVSYKADGSKFVGSGGGGGDVVSAKSVLFYSEDFGKGAAITTNDTVLRSTVYNMSGTAASATFRQSTASYGGESGAALLSPGTTSTGRSALSSVAARRLNHTPNTAQASRFSARAINSAVSDGTNRYVTILGLMDQGSVDAAYNANAAGIYFRYSDDINGGKWEAVVSDGTNVNTADTGVAAAFVVHAKFEILIDRRTSGGDGIRFYINDTLVATIATSVTGFSTLVSGSFLAAVAGIWKTLGTTARSLYVDYIEAALYKA